MHAEPEPLPAPPVEEIDLNEIWAEAEFYYQQGLFDEARKHYEKVIQFDADNARALARMAEIDREQEHAEEFSKLAEAVDELEGLDAAFGVSPPPPSPRPAGSNILLGRGRCPVPDAGDRPAEAEDRRLPCSSPGRASLQPGSSRPRKRIFSTWRRTERGTSLRPLRHR